MTNLANEAVRIQEFAPTLNPQFRGDELHAAGRGWPRIRTPLWSR